MIKHARLQKGESVLVNGASGGVGHFVVQIAKTLGATVTAVCSSRKANFVKECGADKVIAYDKERMAEHSGAYDIVIDVHGNFKHSDFRRLGRRGVVIGFTSMWHMFKLMMKKSVHPFPLVQFSAKPNPDDLASLAKMIEEGSLQPRIDRIFDHHQLAEAIAHAEGMQTLGKVALRWNI